MALLSGIALSPELVGRNSQLSKNRDFVSVLCVLTSSLLASLPSPASGGQFRLHCSTTPQLSPYCLLLPPLIGPPPNPGSSPEVTLLLL